MRHTVRLSLFASLLVMNASAADNLVSMFNEGKVSGQFREFSISRDYDGGTNYTRKANAIGGYIKYETGAWNGLSLGAAAYTTIGFNLHDNRATNPLVDPTLLSTNRENDIYLGEVYLQYKNGNTTFKGGRQKLDTPLAGPDDARMLPSLFEAYVLSNTDVKDTTLIAAHVRKFSAGTFANGYNVPSTGTAAAIASGEVLALTSGYSGVPDATNNVGQFVDMGEYAIGRSNGGVSAVAAVYTGVPGLKLQLWDYYAYDILNAIYAEAAYGWSYTSGVAPYVAAQWINERDAGSNYAGKVKSDFVGAKAGVKVANFDLYGAVSHNSKDASAAINGGTITPWGGMPAYTQGMVTRHQFMAGTNAWKLAGSYDWKNMGVNLNTGVYYASFNMDALNGYVPDHAWTATEAGFDIIYTPETIKKLQLRLRGNFPRDFKETAAGVGTDWNEYRFIANYNF